MTHPVGTSIFGRRKEPHTIIIARGDQISHFTIRPWIATVGGSLLATLALGYLVATSYLVLRDDLIGASIARQARMQHSYEDRISTLREQVDRITSRQLLDQQEMETKVAELIERQTALAERHDRLGPLLQRAGFAETVTAAPIPQPRPDQGDSRQTNLVDPEGDFAGIDPIITGPVPRIDTKKPRGNPDESPADKADKLFRTLNRSIRSIETDQIGKMRALAQSAKGTADTILTALETAGLGLKAEDDKPGVGGPFISADVVTGSVSAFDKEMDGLDDALDRLDGARKLSRSVPIAYPVPDASVSSSFGVRKDPLLGMAALHSGIDFRAHTGQSVHATAYGKVTSAGYNGGYGNMVEVDHGNGFSTRYAHMSKILVADGQKIVPGTIVGEVGTTGRSTGPHLHYEIRRNGSATNPAPYLRIGRKISALF